MGWIYFISMIIACYFSVRKYWGKVEEYKSKDYNITLGSLHFWLIIIITIAFPLALIVIGVWKLLDFLTNKFLTTKNKNDENV